MKILIVKRDKIGDMLLTTPLLTGLRQALPKAEIHVLANDYNAWVLHGNSDVDKLWVVPRIRHDGRLRITAIWQSLLMRRQLRREHFDWVLVGNGEESPRAIRLGLAVKGRHTIAYCKTTAPNLTHALTPPSQGHESLRLARLAEPILGRPIGALTDPAYILPQEFAASTRAWLADIGLAPGTYIVIGLGARKERKKPATEQIIRWARHIREHFGMTTLLVWTPGKADSKLYPGDDEQAEEIIAAATGSIIPFQGSLHQTLGLIWSAATSVIPDSGLMHFAAASPGGVVGLFAHHSLAPPAAQWGPIGARATCIESTAAVPDIDDATIYSAIAGRIGK